MTTFYWTSSIYLLSALVFSKIGLKTYRNTKPLPFIAILLWSLSASILQVFGIVSLIESSIGSPLEGIAIGGLALLLCPATHYWHLKLLSKKNINQMNDLLQTTSGTKSVDRPDLFTLLENLPVGIVLSDNLGQISYCNKYIANLFQYEKEELLGKNVEVLIPEDQRSKHESYKTEYLKNPIEKSMGAGRVLNGMAKDKSLKELEIGLRPIPKTVSTEGALIVAIKDITEEQAVKRDLDEKNKLINIATYGMPSMLAYVSLDGVYKFANNSFLEFWSPEKKIGGLHYKELLPSDFIKDYKTQFTNCISGENINFTRTFFDLKRQARTFDIHLVPDIDPETQDILGVIELSHDITAQSEAERQLKISNQQLEDYAFLVSHDLRAPARHIANFVDLLEMKLNLRGHSMNSVKNTGILFLKIL